MAELEPLLKLFSASEEAASPGGLDPEQALEYVKQIQEFFRNLVDISKLDQYIGLTFPTDEDEGLYYFLKTKLTNKKFNASKEQVLFLVKWILSRNDRLWKQSVAPYCKRLKDIMNMYWKNGNEPSKNQQIALDCLIALMEKYSEFVNETDYEIPSLYWELLSSSEKSKFQPSVRGKMFHCMGLIASFTRNTFFKQSEHFNQLFKHLVISVKGQVESKDSHLEVSILMGCLRGMDSVLSSFSDRVDKKSPEWMGFYRNLEQVIDPKCSIASDGQAKTQLKRREFQRAGLELIANNASYFSRELYVNYEQWYGDLIIWAKSNNSDDNYIGRKAMFRFLESVSEYAKSESEEMETELHENFVEFFLSTFHRTLNAKNVNRSELLVAVKGIGWISTSCGNLKKIEEVFGVLMGHIDSIVLELNNPITDKYSGSLSLVSAYLESAGGILPHVFPLAGECPSETAKFLSCLNSIEQLTVQLITFYPDLSERVRTFAHLSFTKIVKGLQQKHSSYCIPFVDRVINRSLSHIIASPTQAELDILIESWNKANEPNQSKKSARSQLGLRGVRAYVQFWNSLAFNPQDEAVKLVYDRVIQWILTTIERLDLTMLLESEENPEGAGDIFSAIKANVAKDFHLFINLVEFFKEFVSKANHGLFSTWVEIVLTESLSLIKNNPLVSGFYKILATTMEISRSLQYFKEDIEDRRNLFQICNEFMNSLTGKIDEFRDDLLVSVLELWLSAPDEIIIQNFHSLNQTLKVIFGMGRSCLSLADQCIDAFERWIIMDKFVREDIEVLVKSLYPVWQTYFVSAGIDTSCIQESKKSKTQLKSKKTDIVREDNKLKRLREELDDATLERVQLRLLNLIGSFVHVLDLGQETGGDALDTDKKFLKYGVPFQDIKPDIYFDSLIPRLQDLCENSADRQTKASACEMLHTLVLYFLGYDARSTDLSSELFRRIYRTVMKLASDVDILVRQLFNPLAIQSIHWFTQKKSGYSEIILSLIMDGLVQPDDSQLRDFSGACLSEYFVWSLKHDQKDLGKNILDHICSLSTHAVPQYRLGAVVGFNGIYKDFREDQELKDSYTITLFVAFVTSLSLSCEFEDDSVMVKTTKLSISHLERILIKKKDSFNIPTRGRKRPLGFPSKIPCLRDVAEWLLTQIAQYQFIAREECHRLLKVIAPCVKGSGSLDAFLTSFVSLNNSQLLSIAEKMFSNDMDTVEMLQYLDCSSVFYSILNEHGLLKSELLNSSGSNFIMSFRRILIETPAGLNNPKETLRVLSYLPKLEQFFNHVDFQNYTLLSVTLSKVHFDQQQAKLFAQSWVNVELTSESRLEIKSNLDLDVGKFIFDKSGSEASKYCKWVLVAGESKFLENVLDEEEIAEFRDSVWAVILSSIYQTKHGETETKILSKNLSVICVTLLKMWISLGGSEEAVVKASFDQTMITDISSHQRITKGEAFQQVMLEALIECVRMRDFNKLTSLVKTEKVGILVEKFLTLMKKNKHFRNKYGEDVFENVISTWIPLSVNCDHYTVARILSGLAAINLQLCRNSEQLANWWCGPDMMAAQHLSLKEKAEFIGFLGLFALSRKSKLVTNVIQVVEKVVLTDITLDLKWEDEEGYVTKVLLQILSVYENVPKQWKLLEILIRCVSKTYNLVINNPGADPPVFKEIRKRLVRVVKSFIKNREVNEQLLMASCIYNTIINHKECFMLIKPTKLCLIPVIVAIEIKPGRDFFKEHLFSAIDRAGKEAKSIEEWNLKTIFFNIMEMQAHKCGPDFIKDDLNKKYHEKLQHDGMTSAEIEKQKLTVLKSLSQVCIQFKRKGMSSEIQSDKIKLAVLGCNAASYNAVAANLLATSSKTNVLEGLLIHEDRVKNFLWENIIDPSVQYNFPVVLESNEVGKDSQDKMTFSKNLESASNDSGKLQTNPNVTTTRMNLAESSLAVEATHYDFTSSVTVQSTGFYNRIFGQPEERKTVKTAESSPIPEVTIYFSELNKHDCMLPFVATIKKLAALQIQEGKNPDWVSYLQRVLKGTHHINIKTFVIGAFLNCCDLIEPYSKSFVDPILSLILDPTEAYFGKDKLNYFVKDVIIMLLSWHKTYIPSDDIKTKLLTFLVDNVQYVEDSSLRQDVYLHNLDLIKTTVQLWKFEQSIIPCDLIMQNFRDPDTSKIGLGVSRKLLEADMIPSNDPKSIMKELCRSLKNSSKPIHCAAAENIGLLLRCLRRTSFNDLDKAVEYVHTKINGEKGRSSAFVNILLKLSDTSPVDVVFFKTSILEVLNVPSIYADALKLLPICLSEELTVNPQNQLGITEIFFADLDGRKVFQNPCSSVPEFQAGIRLLELFSDHIVSGKKLLKILNWVRAIETFSEETDLKVRYARCVLKIYRQLKAIESPEESWNSMEKKLSRIFLRLFKDNDARVRQVLDEFWSSCLEKWNESHNLILELVKLIGNEENAVEIIIDLLIKRCNGSPEFHKNIFDQGLAECRYFKYDLDTSWRMRHASFQPLFAESLSSSQNFSTLPKAIQSTVLSQRQNVGKFGVNLLRATLSVLEFTPTQNDGSAGSGDMIMGMNEDQDEFQFLRSNSEDSSTPNSGSAPSSSQTDPLAILRKRFYQRPEATFFAKRELDRQATKFASTVENVRRNRSNVKLSRSYRVGDLPDILIKHGDLLKTLSTLGKLDKAIGRSVLVLLFTSMVQEVKSKSSKSARDLLEETKETIETILKNYGNSLDAHFAAALIEIAILNDICLNSTLVTSVCADLDLHELGILELENFLELWDDLSTPTSSKRSRMETTRTDSQEVSVWLGIAEFYKDLEEYDVLKNVFANAATKTDRCREAFESVVAALSLDASGDVDAACEKYATLCGHMQDYDPTFAKFLDNALMNSYMKLSDWKRLFEETQKHQDKVNSDDDDVRRDYLGRIFPLKIRAGLQLYFEAESPETSEIPLNNEAKQIWELANEFHSMMLTNGEDESKFLHTNYPLELTILLASEDLHRTGKSSALLDAVWKSGLQDFSVFSKLPRPQQEQRALMLQQASVVNDVLHWSKGLNVNNVMSKTNALLEKSKRLINHPMAPLINSDMVVAERSLFIRNILELDTIKDEDKLSADLRRFNFHQHLWILSLGIRDKNIALANKYLAKSQALMMKESAEDTQIWRKTYIKYLSTFHEDMELNEWLKMWASAFKKITNNKLQLDECDSFQMQGELLKCLIQCVMGKESVVDSRSKKKVNEAILNRSSSSSNTSSGSCNVKIIDSAMEGSKSLIGKLGERHHDLGQGSEKAANAYLQMHNLLKLLLEQFPDSYKDDEHLLRLMVQCLLRSIDSNQRNGSLLVPTVLPLLEKHSHLHGSFLEESKNVPTWIFLPWLDQIVTSYRCSPSIKQVLEPLIERLMSKYPHAFQLQYTDLLPRNKSSFALMQKYTKALQTLVLPEIWHKDSITNLRNRLSLMSTSGILKLLVDLQTKLREIKNSPDDLYGELHKGFANEMLNIIEEPIDSININENATQTQSSPTDALPVLKNKIKEFFLQIQKRRKDKAIAGTAYQLKDFSPWLAKFHHAFNKTEIELPGLYDELDRPNFAMNPRVVSFLPSVTVLQSITKPLRVTMKGNNGKEYPFLVKYGDDLKQDRRIQQLFRISNRLFDEDCRTHDRKLNLETYAVIPITDLFGITQWVGKTTPLKGFIINSEELKARYNDAAIRHKRWFYENSGIEEKQKLQQLQEHAVHLSCVKSVGREASESHLMQMAGLFPPKLLAENLQARTENVEKFFRVRQTLIKSYAAMCTVHWLLGIGDRHLENCLLSLESGKLIGIDFGRSFGTGNTQLPLPEIVPFRLTPQFCQLMNPYGCGGLFQQTMVHTWRCLLNSSELIISIIDIFVNEQSVNWLKQRKDQGERGPSASARNAEWMPMNIIKKKLRCHNPIRILLEELRANQQTNLPEIYCSLIENGNREKIKPEKVSEERVVELLIDLATDKNLLCRIFYGWAPWV